MPIESEPERLRGIQFLSGTCKMGPTSDSMAVVDQICRIYSVKGLRVAEASINLYVTRANTNATTITMREDSLTGSILGHK
jgi:choline dehydrogenase-like flavoprotein